MELITFLFATIYFTSSVVSSSSLCSNVTPTHLNSVYVRRFRPRDAYSLHECVKLCRSFSECGSFTYNRGLNRCLINYDDSSAYDPQHLRNVSGLAFYYKAAWNKGPCTVHNCAADERCYPTGASYVCKKAIDVCFNQVPVDVCFRRYEGLTMWDADNHANGHTSTNSLVKCVIFCNIHHPTYKVIVFRLSDQDCYCLSISVADYDQQFGPLLITKDNEIYEKIN